MKFIILLLTLYLTVKSASYSLYEYKLKNKAGAILVMFIAIFQLVFTNVILCIFNR